MRSTSIYIIAFSILADYAAIIQCIKTVKPTNLHCEVDPDVAENLSCILKPISWTSTLVTVEVDLKKVVRSVYVNAALFKKYNTIYRPYLANYTVNVCKVLSGAKSNIFYANAIYYFAKKLNNTNAIHKCPFMGHLYGRNMSLDQNSLNLYQQFIPLGMFRVKGFLYIEDDEKGNFTAASGYIDFTVMNVIEKGGKRFFNNEHE